MNTRRRAVLIVVLVAQLSIIGPQEAPQTSDNLVWDTPVASAAPVEFDDFAWDRMTRPLDGVGDSPLVP